MAITLDDEELQRQAALYLDGYINGRLAGLKESQDITSLAMAQIQGCSHDFDNGWAAATMAITKAINHAMEPN